MNPINVLPFYIKIFLWDSYSKGKMSIKNLLSKVELYFFFLVAEEMEYEAIILWQLPF